MNHNGNGGEAQQDEVEAQYWASGNELGYHGWMGGPSLFDQILTRMYQSFFSRGNDEDFFLFLPEDDVPAIEAPVIEGEQGNYAEAQLNLGEEEAEAAYANAENVVVPAINALVIEAEQDDNGEAQLGGNQGEVDISSPHAENEEADKVNVPAINAPVIEAEQDDNGEAQLGGNPGEVEISSLHAENQKADKVQIGNQEHPRQTVRLEELRGGNPGVSMAVNYLGYDKIGRRGKKGVPRSKMEVFDCYVQDETGVGTLRTRDQRVKNFKLGTLLFLEDAKLVVEGNVINFVPPELQPPELLPQGNALAINAPVIEGELDNYAEAQLRANLVEDEVEAAYANPEDVGDDPAINAHLSLKPSRMTGEAQLGANPGEVEISSPHAENEEEPDKVNVPAINAPVIEVEQDDIAEAQLGENLSRSPDAENEKADKVQIGNQEHPRQTVRLEELRRGTPGVSMVVYFLGCDKIGGRGKKGGPRSKMEVFDCYVQDETGVGTLRSRDQRVKNFKLGTLLFLEDAKLVPFQFDDVRVEGDIINFVPPELLPPELLPQAIF